MKYLDRRGQLARHKTRRYQNRPIDGLLGTCDHHTGGNPVQDADGNYVTHESVAAYHAGPSSHLQEGGAPGIAYTFVIEPDGTVVQCWDLDLRTWSQGWKDRPGDENAAFVAVCHIGDFDSKHHRSGKRPTQHQLLASLALHLHLTATIRDPRLPDDLYGAVPYRAQDRFAHDEFGKPACPGDDVTLLSDIAQHHAQSIGNDKAWQEALLELGYKLPRWGADGDWGTESKSALVEFQRAAGLPVTGSRDRKTEQAILRAIDERG